MKSAEAGQKFDTLTFLFCLDELCFSDCYFFGSMIVFKQAGAVFLNLEW